MDAGDICYCRFPTLIEHSKPSLYSMPVRKYIGTYPAHLIEQVERLVQQQRLDQFIQQNYPEQHQVASDTALRDYIVTLKNQHMRKSAPLSKVVYDSKIHIVHNALGLHSTVSRVHGGKLKSKHEIRISSLFKVAPKKFLTMISVHELAHLKQKQHNKAFYRLCQAMLPDYHQLEFDTRLFLIQQELNHHKG